MKKIILAFGMVFLFIISTVTPMVFGYNVKTSDKETITKDNNFENYQYSEYYDCYNINEKSNNIKFDGKNVVDQDSSNSNLVFNTGESTKKLGDPMSSPWPMFCHDVKHSGRSPFSTAENPGIEKWHVRAVQNAYMHGSPVIDTEGTIYTAGYNIYSINPNGTIKWTYDTNGYIWSTPALDEEGTIYVGTVYGSNFYAFYPDGNLKWKIPSGNVFSSPVIGNDGTIYYCDESSHSLRALNSYNGAEKWFYPVGDKTMSSPAIGQDGTVYFGSIDNYLYAINPDGTLKWKFNTKNWVHGSPSVGDDGTVYIGSDYNLYAIYPNNGTMKWKVNTGAIWSTPVIDKNGIIYVGSNDGNLYSIYPNGTINWTYYTGGHFWFGNSPALSKEGIIYFGTTSFGGGSAHFFALNPDGTEKWRFNSGWYETSPAIGEDGTVYIASSRDWEVRPGVFIHTGYLHAFNYLDPNAPLTPDIYGQTNGNAGTEYEYTFKSTSPINRDVYYYIEWGDGDWTITDWIGPYDSGEVVKVSHTWSGQGTYTIRARAKDSDNLWGPWGELTVTMPRDKIATNTLLLKLLERFPLLQQIFIHYNKS